MEFNSDKEAHYANTCSFNFKAYFEDYPIPGVLADDSFIPTEGVFVCFAHWDKDCRSRNCLEKGDTGFLVKGKTAPPQGLPYDDPSVDAEAPPADHNYPTPNPYGMSDE